MKNFVNKGKNMKHSKKIWAMFIMAAMLPAAVGAKEKEQGPSQEELRELSYQINQLKKENSKLDKELSRVDSMSSDEEQRVKKLHENFEKDIQRKKKEIEDLNGQLLDLEKQIATERNKQAKFKNNMAENKARQKATTQTLLKLCDAFELKIKSSLPWELDKRLERVQILKRDVENGFANLEEAFKRLDALYQEEIRFGDEVSMINKPLTRNNGEIINADILKIGNQWMVYSDEEEKFYGILVREYKEGQLAYRWREELSFPERDAVRLAIDVKKGKKPPQLITLPLSISLAPQAVEEN